jgi:hypothetical protein
VSLWLRFSDESALPCVLPKDSALQLERELDPHRPGSLLERAFRACGLRAPAHTRGAPWTQFIPWNDLRVGYLNATLWVEALSSGMSTVERTGDGGFRILPRFRVFHLRRLLRAQWRLSALLADLHADVPKELRLERSLALGLALQLVQMRLPHHSPRELAEWLANPTRAPRAAEKTLELLARIQSRRHSLSSVWSTRFQTPEDSRVPKEFPQYFWDTFQFARILREPLIARRIEGLPVFPGSGAGVLRLHSGEHPLFEVATHQALKSVPHARALFFCRGGLLSHACVLAREQKIACITGLGDALLTELKESGGEMKIRFDAGQGWIERI